MSRLKLHNKTHYLAQSIRGDLPGPHRPVETRCSSQLVHPGADRHVLKVDRGTAFHNELVSELLRMTGTGQSLTTAYSSKENGIVERANQEVLHHLNTILFETRVHDKWSFEQLPIVQRIMNTVKKTSTGVSPVVLILKIVFVLPSEYYCHLLKQIRIVEWVARQSTLVRVARDKQLQTDYHTLVEFNPIITEYPVNSYVLFTSPVGRSDKLLPLYDRGLGQRQAHHHSYPQPSAIQLRP